VILPILRPAAPADARDIAALLSAVVAEGGRTAIAGPMDGAAVRAWMASAPARSCWHVAETEAGEIAGLQLIEPHADLPAEAADIATFVAEGRRRPGIGRALFEATVVAARALGYGWLHAAVRADNESGLIYYRSRGFEPFDRLRAVPLPDGRPVDRIRLARDLR
jgi:L-amino acid N-acyltransferase YncA